MGELKWTRPPPLETDLDAENWPTRLVQWLLEQEQAADYDVESFIAVGGPGVAERMFGFEGTESSYSGGLPHTKVMLAAPLAGKKRIITGLRLHSDGTTEIGSVEINKGGTRHALISFDTTGPPGNSDAAVTQGGSGYAVLDDINESLELIITAGSADLSYVGSYLEVD